MVSNLLRTMQGTLDGLFVQKNVVHEAISVHPNGKGMLEEVEFVKLSKHMGQSKDTTAKSACDLCMVIRGWSQQEQAGTMWVLNFKPLVRSGKVRTRIKNRALLEANCSS